MDDIDLIPNDYRHWLWQLRWLKGLAIAIVVLILVYVAGYGIVIHLTKNTRAELNLVGSIARWRGTQKVMADLLNLPVHVIPDPLATFSSNESSAAPEAGRVGDQLRLPSELSFDDLRTAFII